MILSQVLTIVSMFLVPFCRTCHHVATLKLHNAELYQYGCSFGCGHNVCLCINLLLPPGLVRLCRNCSEARPNVSR